jgi:pimeloyl-ACP methyl ester carboxylesterase
MGMLDLPAMIDHILLETGQSKLSYIGHSQGSTQLFAALTLKEDYFKEKINLFIALGPATNIYHMKSKFMRFVVKTRLDILLDFLNINEIFDSGPGLIKLQEWVCHKFGNFCSGILSSIADIRVEDDDMDRFLVFIGHYPSGSSTISLSHFADSLRHNRFCTWKTHEPYQLENIKHVPIALFVGNDDALATVEDSVQLKGILEKSGSLKFYKVYDDLGHASFFLSKYNHHVPDILQLLSEYNSH